MGKVRHLVGRGTLFFDFRFAGKRCREYTALEDTPANRKRVERVLAAIESDIANGTFVYERYFPSTADKPIASPEAIGTRVATTPEATLAAAPTPAIPATPDFRSFAQDWMRNHAVEWRRSHIKVLSSTIDGHLVPYFGSTAIAEIDKRAILTFRTHLAALPGRGSKPGLSNKRINGILAPLRQMLAEAAELYGFASPMATMKPLKVRKTDVEPFTLDQVQSLLATVRADYRDYFTVRFFTGMRTGEVHGLKWKYVDFANRLILVRESFVLGEDEYTKTDGSQRDIQMTQVVYDALTRQKGATGNLGEYVFCNREGRPLDNKNFTDRVWNPLLRHLDLKPRRPYQMRHTAATLWLASGEAPEWVARQLGHSSTQMLFTVYSRFVPNMTRRDGSAFERLLATRFATSSTSTQQPQTVASAAGAANDAGVAPQGQAPPLRVAVLPLQRRAA